MRRAALFYFSGTGNTEFVARLVENGLRSLDGVSVTVSAMDFVERPQVDRYDTVIVGYPVHGYGIPRPVADFIDRLPRVSGKKLVLFSTFGGLSLGAEKRAARLLTAKGFVPIAYCGVRMPHVNPAGVDVT